MVRAYNMSRLSNILMKIPIILASVHAGNISRHYPAGPNILKHIFL
jgi:hypothetical protein